ncbi:unnamed protein product [Effrenium voratum]|nr:unnamed protein product [Effrenium voratum]
MGSSRYILALILAIRAKRCSFSMLATVCSSWTFLNRSTSKRTLWCPLGDPSVKSVAAANVAWVCGLTSDEKGFLAGLEEELAGLEDMEGEEEEEVEDDHMVEPPSQPTIRSVSFADSGKAPMPQPVNPSQTAATPTQTSSPEQQLVHVPDAAALAVVPAQNNRAPNSVTHRKEYMAFLRADLVANINTFLTMWNELFAVWLEKSRDFNAVALEMKRRTINRTSSGRREVCWSRRQLEIDGRYSAAQIDDLIQRATREGRFIADPNFPNDENLRQYQMVLETSREQSTIHEDESALNAAAQIDAADAMDLVTNQNSGFAEFGALEAIEDVPPEARSLVISIESLECSGELCGALSLHAQAMADLYRELNKLVMAGTNNEDAYATLFEKATSYSNWYKRRVSRRRLHTDRPGNGCELRALTLWGACRFLWATDRPSLFLEPELKACALESGMVALTSYADLSGRNLQRSRLNYKLRPKWHAWAHLVHGFAHSSENCRNHKTLAEEDMLGSLCKIATACPGSNVLQRLYQRYNIFVAMHWEHIINSPAACEDD